MKFKFRIWDKIEKKMISGDIISFSDYMISLNEIFLKDKYIFLQYTGLNDKNGKEIYSGDILNSDEYPFKSDNIQGYLGVVRYQPASYFVETICVNLDLRGCADDYDIDEKEFYIIGNIYENPELLRFS